MYCLQWHGFCDSIVETWNDYEEFDGLGKALSSLDHYSQDGDPWRIIKYEVIETRGLTEEK